MKLLDIKTMRGHSFWSSEEEHLTVLEVEIGQDGALPEETCKSIMDKLMKILPSLFEPGKELIYQHQRGMKAEELIGGVAVELQLLAGMNSRYIQAPVLEKNVRQVVYTHAVDRAGEYAGERAVKIVKQLVEGEYDEISYDVDELIRLKHRHSIGPTTGYLLEEIKRKNIPYRQFSGGSLIILGYGKRQRKIRTAITGTTSGLGMEIASDKEETKEFLADAHVPVPKGILVASEAELRERLDEVTFPVVIKPLNGNHGRGVTTDIRTVEDALLGYKIAHAISPIVIVEEFISGNDYRFLVIDYKLVAVTMRTPASVTGDGKSTIRQLIDRENRNPERGEGPEYVLALIKVDATTEKILAAKKLTLDSVLPKGELLKLKEAANISSGGIATDVTDSVHPANRFLAERIARLFNLDICGIDIMADTVEVPIAEVRGAVIEVNAGPGLRMHSNPQKGKARNVAEPIVNMLFADAAAARIPVVAVAESRVSALVVKLLTHIARGAGYSPGCNSSQGSYIQGHLLSDGKCDGFDDAQEVLFDPTIDLGIVECSDRSILNNGVGFHFCEISVITGSAGGMNESDHVLIKDGIALKTVLTDNTLGTGFTVLNAEDDRVYELSRRAKNTVVLYGSQKIERIKLHGSEGGVSAYVENGKVMIAKGLQEELVSDIKDILFMGNGNEELRSAMLPALISAYLLGIPIAAIHEGLRTFSYEQEMAGDDGVH
jgi:cyanophycin synthetase